MMKLMEIASFSTETLAAQNMVYARRCGAYGAGNYALMAQVKEWAFLKGLMDDDAVILGIARDDMTKVAPENCRYDVCLLGAVDQTPNWLHQVFFDALRRNAEQLCPSQDEKLLRKVGVAFG